MAELRMPRLLPSRLLPPRLALPRLLPTTMAMIIVVIITKAVVLLNGILTDKQIAPFMTSAQAAVDHLEDGPKPVPVKAPPAVPRAADTKAADTKATDTKTTDTKTADAKPSGAPPASDDVSPSERALLLNLRERRQELDTRAKALNEREAVVGAAEQKLDTRVSELKILQKNLEALNTAQKEKVEAGWQSMVKLYEAMKPRDAAAIFNDLSMPVVLQVMDRMKDVKAAAVLSNMTPEKARDVTAGLAQMRTGRAAASNAAQSVGG
jgi:flagellar motility protein MotE (MotC chaperone)